MKSRCQNPRSTQWEWYGGRGIKVCDAWQYFPAFLKDMGMPPTEQHTIDRINSNGDYEPGNCRWATMSEQKENKRPRKNTVWLTYLGETMSVSDWAKRTGIKKCTIFIRVRAGWDTPSILTREPHMGVSPGGWRTLKPAE
jgi:hypothetical protein